MLVTLHGRFTSTLNIPISEGGEIGEGDIKFLYAMNECH